MPTANAHKSIRRFVSVALIASILVPGRRWEIARADASPRADQRSVTYRPVVTVVACQAYVGCDVKDVPVSGVNGPGIGTGSGRGMGAGSGSSGATAGSSGGFTATRTETVNSDGSRTVSESVDYRPRPATLEELGGTDFVMDMIQSRLPLETVVYRQPGETEFDGRSVQVFELGGSGVKDFIDQYGSAIGAGVSGAVGYLNQERAAQQRQAEAAVELDRRFQEGRQVNGQYVRAVDYVLREAAAASASASASAWLQVGLLSQSSLPDAATVSAYQTYVALSQDPFAARSFVLNDVAREAIGKKAREYVNSKRFTKAAQEIESLQYSAKDAGGFESLPQDLAALENGDGILAFENFDRSLPVSPFSESKFKTARYSDEGQVVRRVANRFQATWAESKGLQKFNDAQKTQFVAGLAYLRHADQAIGERKREGGVALRIADALLKGSQGFAVGAANGLKDLVTMVPEIATALGDYAGAVANDPSYLKRSAENLIYALPTIKDALWQSAVNAGDTLVNGSAEQRGELLGRIGFEVALAYATAGGGRAFQALAAATKSTSTVGVAARVARVGQEIAEVARMPGPLKMQVAKAFTKTPAVARDAIGGYRRFLQTAGTVNEAVRLEGAKVSEVLLKTKNPHARSFLKSVISSRANPEQAAKYFSTAADAERIAAKYEKYWQVASKTETTTVEGFVSRSAKPEYVPKSHPEGVWTDHPGIVPTAGRAGTGGPEGLYAKSAAFGKTAEAAEEISKIEMQSYGVDVANMTQHTKPIKMANVLDVSTAEQAAKFGLQVDDLLLDRRLAAAFEDTNILGHVSSTLGHNGILLGSAPARGAGQVLHILKPGLF